MRLCACRPGRAIRVNGPPVNGPPTSAGLTNSPDDAPASSRTATHSRVGVAPLLLDQARSVQMNDAPAGVLNGPAGTGVQAAAGPPVRGNSPAVVAATKVVGVTSSGLAARRWMPRPARLAPSIAHTWSNSAA